MKIAVIDLNDLPPVFDRMPTLDVSNDAAVGAVVGKVRATDADATVPNNVVRYEAVEVDHSSVSGGRASAYFRVDAESGDVSVADDLSKELYDAYVLRVRAFDLGEPSLESFVDMVINVRQVVTVAPDSGVGFVEAEARVELEENAQAGHSVKVLEMEQKPDPEKGLPIRCKVANATDHRGNSSRGKIYLC